MVDGRQMLLLLLLLLLLLHCRSRLFHNRHTGGKTRLASWPIDWTDNLRCLSFMMFHFPASLFNDSPFVLMSTFHCFNTQTSDLPLFKLVELCVMTYDAYFHGSLRQV